VNKEKIFEKLQDIFRDIFDDEGMIISFDTKSDDIKEWDSLNHISLIVAVEKEFHIKFAVEEMLELKDVQAIIDSVLLRIDKI
jgi:acyl carrier protein